MRRLALEQQAGDLGLGVAQRAQRQVQGVEARRIGQQAAQALSQHGAASIVQARTQVAMQHLAAEDAGALCELLFVGREQQIMPGLLVERRADVPGNAVQAAGFFGSEEVRRRLAFGVAFDNMAEEALQACEFGSDHAAILAARRRLKSQALSPRPAAMAIKASR